MSTDSTTLVDLSSIIYPLYMMTAGDDDPHATSNKAVARVHALAGGAGRIAVCCDSGRTFRHDLDPNYKSNRREKDEAYIHEMRLAEDALVADGIPVWRMAGFEADDLIASAVAQIDGPITIVTADKDLLQLVSERVIAKSARDGSAVDADAVVAKYGVRPEQMLDYLCLVGDSSDNVAGAKGIGPKRAADLLSRFGALDALFAALDTGPVDGVSASVMSSLAEFRLRRDHVASLIRLRDDVPLPVDQINQPRTAPDMEEPPVEQSDPGVIDVKIAPEQSQQSTELVIAAPPPNEWERQLEPRSMQEVITLSKHVHDSRLFLASYGTPQAVMATILAGREIGLQSMAALRAMHIIDGKPTLAADLIRAMVLRSGKAKYFRCTERTPQRATFETWRINDPDAVALSFTIEDGRQAFKGDDTAWNKSGWGKNPADMLVARAGAKLARLVYPDVVHGLYSPEELEAA